MWFQALWECGETLGEKHLHEDTVGFKWVLACSGTRTDHCTDESNLGSWLHFLAGLSLPTYHDSSSSLQSSVPLPRWHRNYPLTKLNDCLGIQKLIPLRVSDSGEIERVEILKVDRPRARKPKSHLGHSRNLVECRGWGKWEPQMV